MGFSSFTSLTRSRPAMRFNCQHQYLCHPYLPHHHRHHHHDADADADAEGWGPGVCIDPALLDQHQGGAWQTACWSTVQGKWWFWLAVQGGSTKIVMLMTPIFLMTSIIPNPGWLKRAMITIRGVITGEGECCRSNLGITERCEWLLGDHLYPISGVFLMITIVIMLILWLCRFETWDCQFVCRRPCKWRCPTVQSHFV